MQTTMSERASSGLAQDFRGLRVYRAAFEVAMEVYERSTRWPADEPFALTDRVRRSSRAVCAAIAEAWFKRRYPRHFVAKLREAGREAAETLSAAGNQTEKAVPSPGSLRTERLPPACCTMP